MQRPAHITEKHVEQSRKIRDVLQHDVARRGLSFDSAAEYLARYLGIDVESVRLAVAIANEWAPVG